VTLPGVYSGYFKFDYRSTVKRRLATEDTESAEEFRRNLCGSTGFCVVTPMKRDYARRSGHVSRFTHHLVVNHLKSKRATFVSL